MKTPRRIALLPFSIALATGLLATGAAIAGPYVLAYTDDGDPRSYTNLQAFHADLSAVALGNAYAMKADGSIDSSGYTINTTHVIAYAKSHALDLYATVSDFNGAIDDWDPNITRTVEKNATNRNHAVATLVNLASSNGYTGIDLDFEMVGQEAGGPTATDRANHTAFVTALASALHAQGLRLVQSVPASDGSADYAYYDGYDYASLGAVSDYMQVMTYDEAGPGWSSTPSGTWPGPCSGLDWMNDIMAYMVTAMPSAKILLGLPAYGYDFSTGQTQTWAADKAYGTLGFDAYIASKGATPAFDTASYTPHASWGKVVAQSGAFSGATAQPALWYDNPASLSAKAALVPQYRLGGTGVWAMGYEDRYFWQAHNAGLAGGDPGNIAPTGIGHVWVGMVKATGTAGASANLAVNDGNKAVSFALNPNGEGGLVKWEAAGVIWSGSRTVTSVAWTNGAIDASGNGYFQAGFGLQYTTDGKTWIAANWTSKPAYPASAAAANKTYTFTGTTLGPVRGVRIVGQTGAMSQSGSATEVRVVGE